VRAALDAAGVSDNTYIVATSDNGFHMGQHGLGAGKSTPYASDVVVPLVVLPPGGLAQPVVVDHVVQNVDFLPTFLDLAGAETPASVDGWSFAAAIDGSTAPSTWREGALIEFYGEDELRGGNRRGDPDAVKAPDAAPSGFHALRTRDYLYVDYSTLDEQPPKPGRAELYDLVTDPDEMTNIFGDLTRAQRSALNAALIGYDACAGATCRTAGIDLPSLGLPLP
jgi:arylsulfatase A-like enzyme